MVDHEDSFQLGLKRSSLEGRRIFACPHCQAPGVYSDHASIQAGWPGCYDPTRAQQPVGDTCPNCTKLRSRDQDLGELGATMPLWLWNAITGLRGFIAKALRTKRKVFG